MKSKLDTQLWDFMTELDEFWQDYLINLFAQKILRADMTLKDAIEAMDGVDELSTNIFEKFLGKISISKRELDKPVVINLNTEPRKRAEKRDLFVFKAENIVKSYDDIGVPMNDLRRLCMPGEIEELDYILARLFVGWFTDVGAVQRKLWTIIHGQSRISSNSPMAQSNSTAHATASLELLSSILAKMKKPS